MGFGEINAGAGLYPTHSAKALIGNPRRSTKHTESQALAEEELRLCAVLEQHALFGLGSWLGHGVISSRAQRMLCRSCMQIKEERLWQESGKFRGRKWECVGGWVTMTRWY